LPFYAPTTQKWAKNNQAQKAEFIDTSYYGLPRFYRQRA